MKKFTTTVGVIRDINEKELSELQKSYREYFASKMQKFGVKSPAELDDAKKKEFFNEITKDWEKGKGATEAGKKDVEEHGVKESVNEANQEEQIKKECISKLSDFFGCAPGNLSKFKFDGNDDIKELTKALRSTSDEGTAQYYRVAILMAKRDLGIRESEEVNGVKESEELNEAGVSDSADNLADSLKKNESHFATFLKPKKMNVELSGNVVTLTPASKSFTITADYNKKTVIATAKPAYPESVSYVEILEFFKSRTGFSVTNESEEEGINMSDESITEGNPFIFAAAKAKKSGKDEFEFKGKKYKVTLTADTGVKEGNAFGNAVKKAKEDGESEFELDGKKYKVKESGESEFELEGKKYKIEESGETEKSNN